MKKVSVMLADGFEEVEALTAVDLLRRAKIYVDTVSITDDFTVHGAHGINVQTEDLFDEVDFSETDMIVLPGGMPGTTNLKEHEGLKKVLLRFAEEEKYIGAICAAPTVLDEIGILQGKRATCYPGVESQIKDAILTRTPVMRDGNIITGQGVGTAIDFALKLVEVLAGEEKAKEIAEAIVY
ncbi:MAG: DJ-1/PfpI family protein [Dorea sp.]|uniref:DJ-1 family glyoxalase III n=1 Tax=Dorea sp. YH-dor226 TaxID=3151119 RepID=UPI00302E354C|nr:DJ-1/PfpI family protein [Dorea sp.]